MADISAVYSAEEEQARHEHGHRHESGGSATSPADIDGSQDQRGKDRDVASGDRDDVIRAGRLQSLANLIRKT